MGEMYSGASLYVSLACSKHMELFNFSLWFTADSSVPSLTCAVFLCVPAVTLTAGVYTQCLVLGPRVTLGIIQFGWCSPTHALAGPPVARNPRELRQAWPFCPLGSPHSRDSQRQWPPGAGTPLCVQSRRLRRWHWLGGNEGLSPGCAGAVRHLGISACGPCSPIWGRGGWGCLRVPAADCDAFRPRAARRPSPCFQWLYT